MKTKMKLFIAMIVLVFTICENVNAQDGYEMSFLNDSGVWISNFLGMHINNVNYKHPSISAIGGDTIFARIVDTSGNFDTVDCWIIDNYNTPGTYDTIYSDTVFYILPSDIIYGVCITAYKESEYGILTEFETVLIYPKFLPPVLNLATAPPALKAMNTSDTLTLSDFDIVVNTSSGGCSAYCDSVYWYRDSVMIYAGTDTSYIATLSGDYSIKAKLIYVTNRLTDTCRFVRFQWSNTLTVTVDTVDITTSFEETKNETTFKVYPNPTSDYLYVSDEVEYTIYAISGKEALKGWGNKVDVGDLEPGVYFLRAVNGKKAKFIVN